MILGATFALVVLFATGLAVVEILGAGIRCGAGARAAAALPLGVVVQGALTPILLAAGLVPGPRAAGVLATALAAVALAVRRCRPRGAIDDDPTHAAWTLAERIATAAIAVPIFLLAAASVLEPAVEWDLLAIWGLKARWLALGADLALWREPAFAFAHADYPLAWPTALGVDWTWAGAEPWRASRLLGPALLASSAGLAAGFARAAGRRAAIVAAALVATLPIAGAQAARGLADLPLAALFLLGAGALAAWCSRGDVGGLRLGAVATAGLPLVKQEGMALALAAALVAILRTPGGRRLRTARALAAAAAVLVLPWLFLRAGLPAGAANSFADLTPARLVAGIDRLPALARSLPRYLLAPVDWGALWPLVALALGALLLVRPRPRFDSDLALLLLAPLPLYLAATLAVDYPAEQLAEVTLSRLALHFAPLGAVLGARSAARWGALGPSSEAVRSP